MGKPEISPFRRRLRRVGAVVVLGFLAYAAFDVGRHTGNVEDYCGRLRAGDPVERARTLAAQAGLPFRDFEAPDNPARRVAIYPAPGLLQRYVCEVEHDGGKLTRVRFYALPD